GSRRAVCALPPCALRRLLQAFAYLPAVAGCGSQRFPTRRSLPAPHTCNMPTTCDTTAAARQTRRTHLPRLRHVASARAPGIDRTLPEGVCKIGRASCRERV